jgi:hypothetical protein
MLYCSAYRFVPQRDSAGKTPRVLRIYGHECSGQDVGIYTRRGDLVVTGFIIRNQHGHELLTLNCNHRIMELTGLLDRSSLFGSNRLHDRF